MIILFSRRLLRRASLISSRMPSPAGRMLASGPLNEHGSFRHGG